MVEVIAVPTVSLAILDCSCRTTVGNGEVKSSLVPAKVMIFSDQLRAQYSGWRQEVAALPAKTSPIALQQHADSNSSGFSAKTPSRGLES